MKEKIASIVFFFLLSSLLIAIWFRSGYLYGGGDIGLPEYNPQRILEIINYMWWDVSGTGFIRPSGINGIPLFTFFTILQKIGFSYVQIQMITFLICMFLMGWGMYLLSKKVVGGKYIPYLAGIYYIFNPFTMIQVWHRFVRPAFYFTALLPFFFLLWDKWLRKGKFVSILIFALISLIFSFVFSTLAFMITFWIILGSYSLYLCFFPWKGRRNLTTILIRSVAGLFIWLSTQIWWLYPFFSSAPSLFASQHSAYESVSNLLDLSKKSQIYHVMSGINPFYLIEELDFGTLHTQPFFLILPFIVLIFVLIGAIVAIKKKSMSYWPLLFILGVLLAKGSAPPFGHVYVLGFEKIFLLGVVRNTFEKLGVIVPFSSAVLVAVSLTYISGMKVKFKKFTLIIASLLFILPLLVFSYPILNGHIFGKYDKPPYVEVPSSYEDASKWLSENSNQDDRILHLPVTKSDGIIYNWDVGYRGLEPSDLLFERSSIAHNLGSDFWDSQLEGIENIFLDQNTNDDYVYNYLKSFNIKYVVIHKDVDWVQSNTLNPEVVEKYLEGDSQFKLVEEFGDLTIYELVGDSSKVNKVLNPVGVKLNVSVENKPWVISPDSAFVTEVAVDGGVDEDIIFPDSEIDLPFVKLSNKEDSLNVLSVARFLPGSKYYPLILLKEKLELMTQPFNVRFWKEIDLAGKRLYELNALAQNGNLSDSDINRYEKYAMSAISEVERRSAMHFSETDELILKKFFANQIDAIDLIIESLQIDGKHRNDLISVRSDILNRLSKNGILPIYERSPGRKIMRYDIPKSGEYKLITSNGELDSKIEISINGVANEYTSTNVYLDEGINEISYSYDLSENLARNIPEYLTLSTNGSSGFPIDLVQGIEDFEKDDRYLITFDYWVRNGLGPNLQVVQDSDPYDWKKDEYVRTENHQFAQNDYNFHWQSVAIDFSPRHNANKLDIRLRAEYWNNCISSLGVKKCIDENIYRQYNRNSDFDIRNFSIQKIYNDEVILVSTDSPDETRVSSVDVKRVDPTKYEGVVEIESPLYLFFSETYHPGWKLNLYGDKNYLNMSPTSIGNLYANAWYIEDAGEYKYTIEFEPQNKVRKGVLISLSLFIISLLTVGIVSKIGWGSKND